MKDVVVVLIPLIGTLFGTLGGIVINGKLTDHRLKKLEEKVDKHNHFYDKIHQLEKGQELVKFRVSHLEGSK